MSYINMIIQAIVQGLTEFLPISSSGHLSVASHFIDTGEENLLTAVILHLGTLVAVFILFNKTIFDMIKEFFLIFRDIFKGEFSFREMNAPRRMVIMVIISTAVLIPFYFFRGFFEAPYTDNDIIFEGLAFIYTGILLFLSDVCAKGDKKGEKITVKDSLYIGFFQGVALLPGVSRSGSTITAGIFRGISRETAVTFSFILGIPAILGGAVLELGEAVKSGVKFDFPLLAVGFVTSMIVGMLSIKLLKYIVRNNKFKIFGFYVTFLGLLCLVGGLYEKLSGSTLKEFFSLQ